MPIEVDVAARLRAIAEATVAVAERDGVAAVSFRSVARELGGSTTLVSNYLPTRMALLDNALAYEQDVWDDESSAVLREAPSGQKLRALVRWCCSTGGSDLVMRRMLIAAVAEKAIEAPRASFDEQARRDREALLAAARLDGYPDPERTADAMFLLCRGFYFATVEQTEAWPDERGGAFVDSLFGVIAQGSD
jgi:AcrR family transcriptional regulator